MTRFPSPSIGAATVWRENEALRRADAEAAALKEYWVREALATAGLAAVFFALALVALAGAQSYGLLDTDGMIGLSGRAVMAAEGRMTVTDALAAYPPLPLFVTLPFAYAAPGGAQPAVLASAFIAALFATVLFQNFRYRGFGRGMALVAVLFLTANPLALHALAAGPSAMLMLFTLFVLANGVFGLSAKGGAPDMLLTGAALVMLAFSHPYGLILAAAALPGLSLVAPSSFLARTPGSLFLVLLFPLCFALIAFLYARGALLSGPGGAGIDPANAGTAVNIGTAAVRAVVAAVISAPLVAAFIIWTHRRMDLGLAAVALISLVIGAALLQLVFGGAGNSALVLAGSLPVAAACALYSPKSRLHRVYICVLLLAGAPGGGLIVAANASPRLRAPTAAAANEMRATLQQIRDILYRREGVLVDTVSHPGFVAVRGTARGLVTPGQAAFEMQLQARRLVSEFVVVAQPAMSQMPDRIAMAFPDFYEKGAPDYQLVYDRSGWRVYARIKSGRG